METSLRVGVWPLGKDPLGVLMPDLRCMCRTRMRSSARAEPGVRRPAARSRMGEIEAGVAGGTDMRNPGWMLGDSGSALDPGSPSCGCWRMLLPAIREGGLHVPV